LSACETVVLMMRIMAQLSPVTSLLILAIFCSAASAQYHSLYFYFTQNVGLHLSRKRYVVSGDF